MGIGPWFQLVLVVSKLLESCGPNLHETIGPSSLQW